MQTTLYQKFILTIYLLLTDHTNQMIISKEVKLVKFDYIRGSLNQFC